MSRLEWDKKTERFYETGVDRGVLFLISGGVYQKGEAWNGLTAVNENPSGGEPTKLYANNAVYLVRASLEELGITIEAYTYPKSWEKCDGTEEVAPGIMIGQQSRRHFGLCYRSLIGNDEDENKHGYKLHFIFDGLASPSEKNHETVNDSADIDPFSWEATTASIPVDGYDPCCSMVIDSTKVDAAVLKEIEDAIYGTATTESRMLTPNEIIAMISGGTAVVGTAIVGQSTAG